MRTRADRHDRRITPGRVPTRDRFQILQGTRVVAAVLVALCVQLAPGTMEPRATALLPLSLVLLLAAVAAQTVVARRPGMVLRVLRVMVAVDATYLTVGAYLTGGTGSPLQYGILVNVGSVALLASAGTALVLAALDTLIISALQWGVAAGWWRDTTAAGNGSHLQRVVVFVVVLWVVALSTAALSVVNRRELRRRRHDLDALSLLTERVERAARPAAVAQLLLDAVVSTYGLKRGVVLGVVDDQLSLLAASVVPVDGRRDGSSAAVERAQREHSTLLLHPVDPAAEPWIAGLLAGAGSLLVVPLMADDRPLGALVVEAGGMSRHQRRLITGLERSAAYGALALRNAWLMQSVQHLAATDGLTKIANRRAFEVTLERELARATRNAEYVSLVMVDIDHFKDLNDTLGHQAGDEVLRTAAARLAHECREFDTPARYGGEEFAVVLPGCGPEQAVEIAERLRLSVCTAAGSTPVTASAGVATFPAHAADTESLVRAADEALYASKRGGRDRTTVSAGIAPEEQVNALIRRAVRERLRAQDGPGRDGGGDATLLPLFDR